MFLSDFEKGGVNYILCYVHVKQTDTPDANKHTSTYFIY